MHIWAKRGLQTALVTGGLLMLGTGIASATENVSPDRPASPIDAPLDGGVTVPVHIANNALGTPLGQFNLPSVDRTVDTGQVMAAVPASTPTGRVTDNHGRANLVVPVDISGNAVALGGNAVVHNDSDQQAGQTDGLLAGGSPGPAGGNVVAVNHALPVQVTGNAVSAAGNAATVNQASQSATTGGDITTQGRHRVLSGNVVAEQGATPVQVNGNAITAGGQAHSQSCTDSTATSAGSLLTSGNGGTAAGNVGALPLAVPVELTGQSLAAGGLSSAAGQDTATATGGSQNRPSPRGLTYLQTSGDPATLAGNVVNPGLADPVLANGNAGSLVGGSDAQGGTVNNAGVGGYTITSGTGSTGSGNLVQAPIAEPTELFGNAVSGIGNATAAQSNVDNSAAPAATYSDGDHSTLSSNTASVPLAGANDVFGNGASALGTAAGTAVNTVEATSGGYNGTTGAGSVGSGNIAQLPVGSAPEVFGLAGSAGGLASGTVPSEVKVIQAGGEANGNDDNGTLASNVVTAPTALPAQVFGDAAGLVANTSSDSEADSVVESGGSPNSTGRHATGSGNIVQLPTAVPTQLFNDGASVIGNGQAQGEQGIAAIAGGDASSTGTGGALAGDIVNLADAGPVQLFGLAAAAAGNEQADALSNTDSAAGGNSWTNGDGGSLAGDVVSAQLTQVEQAFGTGVAGLGNSQATGLADTATSAGGDSTSSGRWGSLSGDVVGVPATDVTQAVGDGVSALGTDRSLGSDNTSAVSGGVLSTAGSGPLNGVATQVPLGANLPIYQVPVNLLGRVVTAGIHNTMISDGGTDQSDSPLDLAPGADTLMQADQLPKLADLFTALPSALPGTSAIPGRSALPGAGTLSGAPSVQAAPAGFGLPAVPSVPALQGVLSGAAVQGLPMVPAEQDAPAAGLPGVPALPGLPGLSAVQGVLPGGVPQGLPMVPAEQDAPAGVLPGLPALPELPGLSAVQGVLPTAAPQGVPATQDAPAGVGLPGLPSLPALPALPVVSGVLPGSAVNTVNTVNTAKPATQDAPAESAFPTLAGDLLNSANGQSAPVALALPTAAGLPAAAIPSTSTVAPSTVAPQAAAPQFIQAGTPAALLSELPGLGGLSGGLANLGQSGVAHPMV